MESKANPRAASGLGRVLSALIAAAGLSAGAAAVDAASCEARDVKWTWRDQDVPEWSLVMEQDGSKRPVEVDGARQSCRVERDASGVVRYRYDALTDGPLTWKMSLVLESRPVPGGLAWTGTLANNDAGMRATSFLGPWKSRLRAVPEEAALYVAEGYGRRIRAFPSEKGLPALPSMNAATKWKDATPWRNAGGGIAVFDTPFNPGPRFSMPWIALDTGFGTFYAGVHDARARPKAVRVRWAPHEALAGVAFRHRLTLRAGEKWSLPETVFARERGDWHDAARRYRAWYDSVHAVRAAAPDWTRDLTGWLLVIMKQQNEELMWPYTDIPRLCDVAERNGLNCIGLFGWTVGGHDHLYPDYDPDPKMGGAEALKAGIVEAHRRGIRVCIYANGQLQQMGATKFWDEHGRRLAICRKNGSLEIQTYHKYSNIPKYEFALGCLSGAPWHDRMLSLARQASGLGADAILYDQLGMSQPFECWGRGHGHPVPAYVYGEERPGFIRSIADAMNKSSPGFAVFTEGLHDSILDSISLFHGCQYGAFVKAVDSVRARADSTLSPAKTEAFPEMWRYTFPELVSTMRFPTPMATRHVANYAALFGFRHEIELRYAPDRKYVLDGKVPSREDYGTVNSLPSIAAMQSVAPAAASAYLRAVCDFQRAHAKYLMRGRFADEEGFTCSAKGVVAKRFVADDGTCAVIAWNVSDMPQAVEIRGLGGCIGAFAPAGEKADGDLAADSIRLYAFEERQDDMTTRGEDR